MPRRTRLAAAGSVQGISLAHCIEPKEDVAEALWRLIRDDLANARKGLLASGSREQRIHRVRQRIKRVRSLLRVIAPSLPDGTSVYREALAEAAHALAGARDADAAAASARGLRDATGNDDAGLDRVVAVLDDEAAKAHRHAAPVADAIPRLARVETEFTEAPADMDGVELYNAALARSYRKGRRAMRLAASSLATPDLHSWRKAVKDLWYLLRLGRRRLPKRAEGIALKLGRLGETLGLDHDHAMLAERLALSPTGDPALMRQLSLIARERRSLEAESFALGAAVYKRKPKKFARKIKLK